MGTLGRGALGEDGIFGVWMGLVNLGSGCCSSFWGICPGSCSNKVLVVESNEYWREGECADG